MATNGSPQGLAPALYFLRFYAKNCCVTSCSLALILCAKYVMRSALRLGKRCRHSRSSILFILFDLYKFVVKSLLLSTSFSSWYRCSCSFTFSPSTLSSFFFACNSTQSVELAFSSGCLFHVCSGYNILVASI